jgi:hypothetical protein
MRIGGSVYGGSATSKNGPGHGLSLKNDVPEILSASKASAEVAKKKKIVENFESVIAGRVEADGRRDKTGEERDALVKAVTGAIDRIRDDFGQETTTEAMAEILMGTEQTFNAATVATSLGKVLRDREAMVAKIAAGKLTEKDVPEFERMFGKLDKDIDTRAWLKETQEKLAGLVDFFNGAEADDEAGEVAATLAATFGAKPLTAAEALADGSLAGALNGYYGQAIISEEARYSFTDNFEWLPAAEAEKANRALLETRHGLDFRIAAGEIGKDAIADLARFLRDELGDAKGAALIEGLGDGDDVIAAVNSLMKAHATEEASVLAGPLKLAPDGSPLMAGDDPDYWTELNRQREAEYARLTAPNYEVPVFNYDSDYGYGFADGRDFKWGDYQADLASFLGGAFLDRVNEVVRTDSEVRARFMKVAAKNFGGMENAVPDNYGFIGFPTSVNMGQISASKLMGVADTTAPERALRRLRNLTYLDENAFVLKTPAIVNGTDVKEKEFPGFSELLNAERINVYEGAVARYEAEKSPKGLLLEETV